MHPLTDSDRTKVSLLVRRLTELTRDGEVSWERDGPGAYSWSGSRGTVVVRSDRLVIIGRGENVVDVRDFPGADHLWQLVDDRFEEETVRTINAILHDLERLEAFPSEPLPPPRPPRPKAEKPPATEERGIPFPEIPLPAVVALVALAVLMVAVAVFVEAATG